MNVRLEESMFQKVVRRSATVAIVAGLAMAHPRGQGTGTAVDVQVYKQPGCGCCELWAQHMRKAGFKVTVAEAQDVDAMKRQHGIPINLRSCHTSLIGGYKVEGHVPVDVVKRLLNEKPAVSGIAVPGMPIGSPGMEAGSRVEPYNVYSFDAQGRQPVFASVNK
jgi:hypothetical protein